MPEEFRRAAGEPLDVGRHGRVHRVVSPALDQQQDDVGRRLVPRRLAGHRMERVTEAGGIAGRRGLRGAHRP